MDSLEKVKFPLNIPNQLTISRFVLAIIIMFCLTINTSSSYIIAFILFIIAAITDALDGILARKVFGCTTFGKLMDPLADKVLLTIVFISLVKLSSLDAWMVSLILARELMVTGLRLILMEKSVVLSADKLGKLKTVIQMIAALLFLAGLCWPRIMWLPSPNSILAYYIGLTVVVITLCSGISYFYSYRKYIV